MIAWVELCGSSVARCEWREKQRSCQKSVLNHNVNRHHGFGNRRSTLKLSSYDFTLPVWRVRHEDEDRKELSARKVEKGKAIQGNKINGRPGRRSGLGIYLSEKQKSLKPSSSRNSR